jgi:hypothetical protein
MRCPGELSHVNRLNIIDWRFIADSFRRIQRRRDRGDGLDPKDGTDKLTPTSDRNPADRRLTEPLHFSKTQEPAVEKIDNDWPISDAVPS